MDSNFSRIPVYDDSIDNIIGSTHRAFLKRLTDTEDVDIRSILIDVCYFHQTMTLPDAFTELQRVTVNHSSPTSTAVLWANNNGGYP